MVYLMNDFNCKTYLFFSSYTFSYQWRVNVDVLESHRKFLVQFPEYLKEDHQFRGPILFFGGTRSTQLK